jgi:hypothetical protein
MAEQFVEDRSFLPRLAGVFKEFSAIKGWKTKTLPYFVLRNYSRIGFCC